MKPGRSIRSTVFLTSIIATLVVASSIIGVWYLVQAAGLEGSIARKAELVALRLGKSLSNPLWGYDVPQCDEIVRSELVDPDIHGIEVREPDGRLILSWPAPEASFRPSGDASEDPASGGGTEGTAAEGGGRTPARSVHPVSYNGTVVGTITVTADGSATRSRFGQLMYEQAFLILAVGIIVALVLFVAVDRRVSRRVARLRLEIGGFSDRDFGHRVSDHGGDEIGDLAVAFNSMAERLQRYGNDLEGLVLDRTRELAEKNEELLRAYREVGDRLAELKLTQDQLVESAKLAEIGRIVAQIVHDLNTPVAAVGSAVELIGGPGLDGLARLPALARQLSSEQVAWVEALFAACRRTKRQADFKGDRSRRREYTAVLEASGVADAAELAGRLVELGIEEVRPSLPGSGRKGALGEPPGDLLSLLGEGGGRIVLATVEALVLVSRSVETLADATERARHVVTSLRNYLHREQAPDESAEVDIAADLEAVIAMLSFRLGSGIAIDRDMDRRVRVRGVRNQLAQVWMNLIDNALQAMGDRGRLGITLRRQGDRAIVEIADEGGGIPEEAKGLLFQAFFTTKKRGEGTGLGLSIAKRIIEEHGGDIRFEDRKGGTTFTVSLPAATAGSPSVDDAVRTESAQEPAGPDFPGTSELSASPKP